MDQPKAWPDKSSPDTGRGWYTRGYIPHFDSAHVIQFITWRLADSLPPQIVERLLQQLEFEQLSEKDAQAEKRKRLELQLDRGYGQCWLRRHRCAQIVHDVLLAENEQRYVVHAFVIMPNHLHVLVHFLPGYAMGDILDVWKDVTSHRINEAVRRKGQLWQEEYWDRYIRDAQHYADVIRYIRLNPVKAGLVKSVNQWRWLWDAT